MSNIQESLLQAAIPGQSLTDEPKNFPWERAAEYSDPTEAARYELKKLNKPEILDSILALLQTGFPIIPLAETIKTNSQAAGLYNPDIGLLITPVIKICPVPIIVGFFKIQKKTETYLLHMHLLISCIFKDKQPYMCFCKIAKKNKNPK